MILRSWVVYMDQATALNGKKKTRSKVKDRSIMRSRHWSLNIWLSKGSRPTSSKKLSPTEELVHKVEIIPLEAVTRNVATGHFVTRFGVKDGQVFKTPVGRNILQK